MIFLKQCTDEKLIYKVSITTILVNLILTLLKLFAGIFGRSMAMVSDAIHSGSDVLSTLAVMIGAKFSNKAADKKHPYGHEKIESVTSILLALMLFVTAVYVGTCGVLEILKAKHKEINTPSGFVIWFAILSIAIKEWMYHYTLKASKKTNSSALYADAWHHRSDAISSIGSLIGVAGAILGFQLLDPIASIIICFIIVKVAFDIAKTGFDQLIDTSASKETEDKIRKIINGYEKIKKIDVLRTRQFGSKVYVDIEVQVDKNMEFEEVHDLTHKLRNDIEKNNSFIKSCMIHANPTEK